jgi:uncharacterized delta-60 repeat protein
MKPGIQGNILAILQMSLECCLKKILIGLLYWGSAWPLNHNLGIARYKFSSGELDAIFSTVTDMTIPRDIQRLPDGGYIANGGGLSKMLKYFADGSRDFEFSDNLSATISMGTHQRGGYQLYVYPDGRLLVGCGFPCLGLWHQPTEHQAPFRLLANGTVDSTFTISSNGGVHGVSAYNDSLLMVTGLFMEYDNVPMFAIARIDTAGELDTTFQSPFVFPTIVDVVEVDTDGKVLVSGSGHLPSNDTIYALIRLNPDGSIDETFHKVPERLILPSVSIFDVKQTTDGGYLVVGEFHDIHGIPRRNIAKLHNDGSLDENYFNGQGLVLDTADLSAWSNAYRIVYDEEEDHYYIAGGRFNYFDGQHVPRVIRLKGLISSTSTPETVMHTFNIHPNPATETITLNIPEVLRHFGNYRVEIHNQLGQRVLSDQSGSETLQIGHLPAGMYFVSIRSEQYVFQPQKLIVR